MRVQWLGDRAVVIAQAGTEAGSTSHVATHVASSVPGVVVRAGMTDVLVEATCPMRGLLGDVMQALTHFDASSRAGTSESSTVHSLTVTYDGTDLIEVAATLGITVAALIEAHQEQQWRVAMMGFAPGFAYLVPVAPVLDWSVVARRSVPRERVPAGSVALAAGMSAVYPEAMPGGWHLLGTCDARLFDPQDENSPTLLRPGDGVRFEAGVFGS